MTFRKHLIPFPGTYYSKNLYNYGIRGHVFNIIKDIYKNDESCIKIGYQCTEPFHITQGVRQGCVLNPLLFNIFIANLVQKLDMFNGKVKVNNKEISSIFWADDVVIFSENENGLRAMTKVLDQYATENKLEINTDKTKIMICNKTGIECVRCYKYLGFLLTTSGEINSGLKDLRNRALKSCVGLKNSLGTSFNQDIKTTYQKTIL